MQIREIQRNKPTARIYFIRIMHCESVCEVGVLRRGVRNSPVSLASDLTVYMVSTDLKGILKMRYKSDATASVAGETERHFGRLKPSATSCRLASPHPHTNWTGCCVDCRVVMNVAINRRLLGLSDIQNLQTKGTSKTSRARGFVEFNNERFQFPSAVLMYIQFI